MSSNNSSFFSNGFPSDNLTFKGNLYSTQSTPILPLGFRVGRADGNCYRYGQFSTLTSPAMLVSPTNADYSGELSNALLYNGSAATAVAGQVAAPGTVGSRFVQVQAAAVVANQYAGGYLVITSGTAGTTSAAMYRIKGNTVTGSPIVSNYYIELYDPLMESMDVTTDIHIVTCPYSDLIVQSAASTGTNPVGVTMTVQLAANPFGFIQTWGVAAVLNDAHALLGGDVVQPSNLTSGAVGLVAGGSVSGSAAGTAMFGAPVVGYALDTCSASFIVPIYLTISR